MADMLADEAEADAVWLDPTTAARGQEASELITASRRAASGAWRVGCCDRHRNRRAGATARA